MSSKNKKTLWQIVGLIVVLALVIIGGRIERGYYAVASEPFLTAVWIAWIIYSRRVHNGH